jgi:hypothetical protein
MRPLSVVIFVGFLALAVSNFAADKPPAESSTTSLADAVKEFNESFRVKHAGKDQPPLTEDEVVAAIRGWVREFTPPVTDEVYDAFQKVAETRVLPKGAKIDMINGWKGYRGFSFDVWWIDLRMPVGEKSGYAFRIRSRTMSSRPLNEEEKQQIENQRIKDEANQAQKRGEKKESK